MKVYVVMKCNPEYCEIESIWANEDQAKKQLKDYTYEIRKFELRGMP